MMGWLWVAPLHPSSSQNLQFVARLHTIAKYVELVAHERTKSTRGSKTVNEDKKRKEMNIDMIYTKLCND